MPSYSHAVIVGNLTRDPELRYTPGGAPVCDFTVAVNRKWTDSKTNEKKEDVSFLDCVAWNKTAELIAKYMAKGRPILVSGDIRQERWETDGGEKKSRVKIHVERMQFLDSGNRDQAPPSGGSRPPATAHPGDDEVDPNVPF